jgi:hypothetical protein
MNHRHVHALALILVPAAAFIVTVGCGKNEPKQTAEAPKPAPAPAAETWIALFDGVNLDAFTMEKPGGWVIADSAMALTKVGGSIWTKERFGNFVLDVEFKVSKDCNSGIFLRTGDLKDPVQTGIEMQVLDSAGKAKPDKHDSGALYDLLAPSANTMKPAGEWNRAVITCHENHIMIELNGTQIIMADLNTWTTPHKNPDGTPNKFNLALKDFPREGHIGFQDHGFPVWYRNVKVKKM